MDGGHDSSGDARAAEAVRVRVIVRPLDATDAAGVAALFDRMSAESRRRRYLTSKERLSPRELRFLTDVDHVRHEAVAAVDTRDGSIVAIARYVQYGGRPGVADVAVEVADDLQAMGIGTMVARRLLERGWANGITAFEATILWENRAARALARRLGFRARSSRGREIELVLGVPATRRRPPVAGRRGP